MDEPRPGITIDRNLEQYYITKGVKPWWIRLRDVVLTTLLWLGFIIVVIRAFLFADALYLHLLPDQFHIEKISFREFWEDLNRFVYIMLFLLVILTLRFVIAIIGWKKKRANDAVLLQQVTAAEQAKFFEMEEQTLLAGRNSKVCTIEINKETGMVKELVINK